MTRSPVSSFTRAALVAAALAAPGCDLAGTPGAHVDLDAMAQAQAPMNQLVALTDMTMLQVDEGVSLADLEPGPSGDVEAVVVTAFGEEGSAVFVPVAGFEIDPVVPGGDAPAQSEPPSREDEGDRESSEPPRPFRLLWSNFTSGGLGLNGDLELADGGVATAEVTISMGGAVSELTMDGRWTRDGGGADVSMQGSMTDDQGVDWNIQTDALRLETGCAVASGGRWLAEARPSSDGTMGNLRFEVRYDEGCGGCADLFVNGSAVGRSCVGGN